MLCDSNSSPCNSASRPLSAGDLPSAESILEVHEREIGCDTAYPDGLVWDTRGTVLLDSSAPASTPPRTTLLVALGAQIKVQAHVLGHAEGRKPAVAYLDVELVGFAQPVALRSRLYKRRNQLTLVCAPAPAIVLEESLTPNPPTRSRLRGKPILIFGWAQWCGDCRSQVAARGLIKAKYTDADKVSIIALARCYETDKTLEKALIKKAWAEFDQPFQSAPVLIPPAAMERYGVSSTPTFIFLDNDGKVTHYLPCRLTEAALEKLLGALPCQITGTRTWGSERLSLRR